MLVKKVKVLDAHGLHLREAARIVRASKNFKSRIHLFHDSKLADALSILDVLALAVTQGNEITVIVEGPDEKEAAAALEQVFQDGAGI